MIKLKRTEAGGFRGSRYLLQTRMTMTPNGSVSTGTEHE